MIATIKIRARKCKVCRAPFTPRSSFQKVCNSVQCSVGYTRKQAQHAARREKRAARERLMTRSDWMKKTQVAFNKFIRLRDAGRPCICCGKPLGEGGLTGGGFDAGHYRSVGSAPHLRFVEDNCHAQRKHCNQYGSGRAVDYRIGLIARIGLARVEAIEADQAPRKYTIEELQELTHKYRAMARGLARKS